jgi:hypothetical protein
VLTSNRNLRYHILLGVFVVTAGAAVLFPKAFHPDNDLLPVDILYNTAPWTDSPARPAGNPLLTDIPYQPAAWDHYRRNEHHGVPLWNAWNGCGQPFMANGQTSVFSPFRLPPGRVSHGYLLSAYRMATCSLLCSSF